MKIPLGLIASLKAIPTLPQVTTPLVLFYMVILHFDFKPNS